MLTSKFYIRLLQGGLIISLFFVLFVFKELLFPFITSKQIPFNILMEVLLAIWLFFILRFPAYRPKLNLIAYGLVAYFGAILLSSFFGVDFNLSFWGDIERMLGFFHLFHFLIFYFILITVFRSWQEWKVLLLASVVAAVIVSLIGLFGVNSYSTIGNTAYVSGYLIFNLFFAVILFFRSQSSWRYLYLLPIIIMAWQFKGMRTSGAIIGLACGILVVLLLVGLLHQQKKIRYSVLLVSALAIASIIFIFSQQNTAWFKNSFLKNLTSQKATFQTRLISWRGAWQAFPERPILGTGFGNYAIIFDKYFDAKFFDYDRNETYFDRAHNNLIDITSTTGLIGLITYLSAFIFATVYLYKELKAGGYKISNSFAGKRNLEIVLVFGLMVAYFVQNLAIFDSFVTYIALMIMLGFLGWRTRENILQNDKPQLAAPAVWLRGGRGNLLFFGIVIITWVVIFQYNVKPLRMLIGTIDSYKEINSGRILDGLNLFKASLTGTQLDRDSRSSLVSLAIANPVILTSLSKEQATEWYEYIVDLSQQNLNYNNQDSLFQLQMSQLYDLGAKVFSDDLEKKNFYAEQSLLAAEKAIEASPGRIPVYFYKAQALLMQNKTAEAINVLEFAASLNTNYPLTYCRLAQMYILVDKDDQAVVAFNNCIDGDAVSSIGNPGALLAAASFLVEREDYVRAIVVVEKLLEISPDNSEIWLNLVKLYLITGDNIKAAETAGRVITLYPDMAATINGLFE